MSCRYIHFVNDSLPKPLTRDEITKRLIFQCKLRQCFERRPGISSEQILRMIKINKQLVKEYDNYDIDLDFSDLIY
jgi:hypothetical protein